MFPKSKFGRVTTAVALVISVGVGMAACKREDVPPAERVGLDAAEPTNPPPRQAAAGALPPEAASSSPIASAGRRVPRESDYYPTNKPAKSEALIDSEKPYTNLGPVESPYLTGKFLNERSSKAMRLRNFDNAVLDLGSEGDGTGGQKQQMYIAALQASLAPYADRARLGRVACARVICMGSIQTNTKDWVNAWKRSLMKLKEPPMPTFSSMNVRTASGIYEVRFTFTTMGIGGYRGSAGL